MKFNRAFWLALTILSVWLLLAWFLGPWLGITPPILWFLRVGLCVLGVVGFAGYLFLRQQQQDSTLSETAANIANEIDYNFALASLWIHAAIANKQLNSLPTVFLLGDAASAKTTILTQSGIEPELIAGEALASGAVIPTASVNLWYARNTLFIDPSGYVLSDPAARRMLFKKFSPLLWNSLLTQKTQPARSVLLTLNCETFLQSGGASAVAAKARQYHDLLNELSRELGASFPVYVLFTKADKIPYLLDFVQNLNESEVAEIMGLSLPLPATGMPGEYADQQAQRLDNAFQTLYYSLADKRPLYLGREPSAASLSNIYEFPREFAKLRSLLVQFLTDLCRTNSRGTSPFLRGFYFTGVRPVIISDLILKTQAPVPLADPPQASSQKIPQWVFLQNLFPGVLLADQVGSAAAQVNTKVNFVRRAALAIVAGLSLLMTGCWTVAYNNNSNLIQEALAATRAVPWVPLISGQLASTDTLQKLSKVRETLALLKQYERARPPLSYRAFLYQGSAIQKPLRVTYYALFWRLLLQPTQQTLLEISKDPGDDKAYPRFQYVYNSLKAYLMTTNNHDKRWNDFVSVLVLHWKKGQPVASEQEAQASSHFAFYADELPQVNPYPQSALPDSNAVDTARAFLNEFSLQDSFYRPLLEAAGDRSKSIQFNRDYPGTAEVVRNSYDIAPAFTRPAYASFQKGLLDLTTNLGWEDWVLGRAAQQNVDLAQIRADLKPRYDNDYVHTWREFLAATSEPVPYVTYARAASVLEKLGAPQSALMQLFCVVSENTSVGDKGIAQAFQPVQLIAPPGCPHHLVGPTASPYVRGLANLSSALKVIGPMRNPNPPAALQAQAALSNALNAESALALAFQPDPADPEATVVTKSGSLLTDPIAAVPAALEGLAGAPINAQAANTCAAINPLFQKYPFQSGSKQEATLAEVNDVLNPQAGKLWTFVNSQAMNPFLQKSGSQSGSQLGRQYSATLSQSTRVTPAFLNFVNRAAVMTQAFYHADATGNPNMTFRLAALPSPDVNHVALAIDGNMLAGDPNTKPAQRFDWPGPAPGVSLRVSFGSSTDFAVAQVSGLWALWHFLDMAEPGWETTPQWVAKTPAGQMTVKNRPLTIKFSIAAPSADVLRPQFFAGLACPGPAVQ